MGSAGCSEHAVPVPEADLPAGAAATCRDLVAAAPATLAGEDAREVDPADAPAAAWGDPPIVLTCGVGRPAGFDRFSTCQEADGVGWFVPESQVGSEPTEVTLTAVGYRPRVRLVVPADYWPTGSASAIAALADPVRDHLRLVQPCR